MVGTGATDAALKVMVPPTSPAIDDMDVKHPVTARVDADVFRIEVRSKGIIVFLLRWLKGFDLQSNPHPA
jgi:hypothetical protein